MREKLQEILKLTPKDERVEKVGRIGRFLMGKNGLHRLKWNYGYIAVLAFRSAFFTSAVVGTCVLGLVFVMTEIYGVIVKDLKLEGQADLATQVGFVGFYAYLHAKFMTYAIWFIAFACFLLFLVHVPKGSEDVFARDLVLSKKENRTSFKKLKRGLLFFFGGGVLGYLMSVHSYIALSFVVRWLPEDSWGGSLPFILFYYIFSLVAHGAGAMIIYGSIMLPYGLVMNYDKYWGINQTS